MAYAQSYRTISEGGIFQRRRSAVRTEELKDFIQQLHEGNALNIQVCYYFNKLSE